MTAQRLIDRYNVALAQAVLLRSVRVEAEIRNEGPRGIASSSAGSSSTGSLYRVQGAWPTATSSRSTAR